MVSKIILTLLIGLVICATDDFNIQEHQEEFQSCQQLCENKGIFLLNQCINIVALRTSNEFNSPQQRCYRIIEGMINDCTRSQCIQGQDQNSVFQDFLSSQK
ncbi:unnamed protein product (macronuclear) [Paramecium tetraurelia]|uniref:Uncharacterized protein n=1 Tax=Paramecium tetraurelia TaxID=5888 RepID=A0EG55_PARTE|nr:uncharacterized protein GSPATT00026619001 [Paramecium tetraurelia]CAK94296.1 unnamed protein product [Paramecium tetraurelia]|eukprot:XP_001461669.1 hypothetical protein (macronuclear) [Paramecium tetraurelia strain d4-2]